MKRCRWGTATALITLILCYPAYSQEATGDPALPAQAPMDMAQVIALLQQQQKELAEQNARLDAQANKITALTQELDTLRAAPGTAGATLVATDEISEQTSATADPTPVALAPDTSPTAATALAGAKETGKSQQQKRDEGEAAVAQAQTDDPTQDLLSNFPGAWRLPGTSAAFGIGGHIRTTVVLNEDVLEIPDRFIVGSIPVDQPADGDNAAQSSITANQSRLNFDMRDTTSAGILRAFIEGDFTGDGDSFRLRHAFGQWDRVLAGQTWSAFVDTEASPEEVDFEGLNGRINVRQSQVRWSSTHRGGISAAAVIGRPQSANTERQRGNPGARPRDRWPIHPPTSACTSKPHCWGARSGGRKPFPPMHPVSSKLAVWTRVMPGVSASAAAFQRLCSTTVTSSCSNSITATA